MTHQTLSYDPSASANLALIQASALAMNTEEFAAFEQDGFTVADRLTYPSFAYGYGLIYSEDLPVYISSDVILNAMHRSYDKLLRDLEEQALVPALTDLLNGFRSQLTAGGPAGYDALVRQDIDTYAAIALSLLLGNNQATALIADDMAAANYAPQLHEMRVLTDVHPPSYWDQNLYTIWLSSLRSLSPTQASIDGATASIFGTEKWGRRVINSQLASWAELRHDTILYAKQSYTGGGTCEFPDAYVEPNPAFFGRVATFASQGGNLLNQLNFASPEVSAALDIYFANLLEAATMLQAIAQQQETGVGLSQAQLDFVNDAIAVRADNTCGAPPEVRGWLRKLFYDVTEVDFDPTIADVHTNPNAEDKSPVLHVATGRPRIITVSIETRTGPRWAQSSYPQKSPFETMSCSTTLFSSGM